MKRKSILLTLAMFASCFLFAQKIALLKDLNPGGNGCDPYIPLVSFNGKVFFAGQSGTDNSFVPYFTDGKTILKLSSKRITFPDRFTVSGNNLFFFGYDSEKNTDALFVSDGTNTGTKNITNVQNPRYILPFGTSSIIFIVANVSTNDYTLMKSDGTAAGTISLGNFSFSFFNTYFSTYKNSVIISEKSTNTTKSPAIITDGTKNGTKPLKDFLTNVIKFETIESVTSVKDKIFVDGYIKDATNNLIRKKYITDLTVAGTKVSDYSDFQYAFDVNNSIVVTTQDYVTLYNSSTNALEEIAYGKGSFSEPIATNNKVFYHDQDSYVWSYDIATKKTKKISTIPAGKSNYEPYLYSKGDSLFYNAYTANGVDLYAINLKTGKDSLFSNLQTSTSSITAPSIAPLKDQLIFKRTTDAHGVELWTNNYTIPIPHEISHKIIDPIKCWNDKVKVEMITTGGTAPYTYTWADPKITGATPILGSGSYLVTSTDSKGASVKYSLNLWQAFPDKIEITFSIKYPTSITQNNGSATASVTGGKGGYSYLWSTSQKTATADPLKVGTYSLTVTDVNGCSEQKTVEVILEPNCSAATAIFSQNINQNPMIVTNASDNYAESTNQFAFYPKDFRQVFYNTGLWLIGYNKAGNYKAAAATYRSTGRDFHPGILDAKGEAFMKKEFDKVWFVSRYDIEQHLADYANNQKIDKPIATIYAWPGKGNPFFKQYNNFDLPNRAFAPFIDNNNDGIYDPSKGDYPLPEGMDKNTIPEIATWTVFNDNAKGCTHSMAKGEAFPLEIQQTTWGFNSQNSNVLDHTNFASFKMAYKGTEQVDSTYFGIWSDPDLGCYVDDYVGCSPAQNAYFTYNKDDEDGNVNSSGSVSCPGAVATWKKSEMPVGSIKLLNQKMDGFIYYNNGGQGTPNPATTDPSQTIDFYRYLNSTWKDGTPLTAKDFGYNPAETVAPTKFAFSGNPNDSTQNSMRTANKTDIYKSEARAVGSVKIGKLQPNQEIKIDVAYAMHRKKDNTVSQNLDLMYKGLDSIQNTYNQKFKNIGTSKKYCSSNDCVYPGDANNDGIVNYKDLVFMGNASTDTGSVRKEPLIFAPLNATNWTKSFNNGVNLKHADATGDGIIEKKDRGIINQFYNFTTPTYQKQADVYPTAGTDITLSLPNEPNPSKLLTNKSYRLFCDLNLTEVQSLGFELEIDTNYIKVDTIFTSNAFTSNGLVRKNNGTLDLATSTWSKTSDFTSKIGPRFTFVARQLTPIYPSRCTKIRVKNIVAFKKDGTPITLTAKDMELCFTDITTGNEDLVLPNPIQVMPNPFEAQLTIKNYAAENVGIQLFDVVGRSVKKQKVAAEATAQLDTNDLPKGVYFLECSNGKQHWTTKVVKN